MEQRNSSTQTQTKKPDEQNNLGYSVSLPQIFTFCSVEVNLEKGITYFWKLKDNTV